MQDTGTLAFHAVVLQNMYIDLAVSVGEAGLWYVVHGDRLLSDSYCLNILFPRMSSSGTLCRWLL
jgi:hypothetical protein